MKWFCRHRAVIGFVILALACAYSIRSLHSYTHRQCVQANQARALNVTLWNQTLDQQENSAHTALDPRSNASDIGRANAARNLALIANERKTIEAKLTPRHC